MADLALDFDAWDCYIAGGIVAEINTLENPDEVGEVRQRAAIAYKTHKGELAFDTSRGLAWSEDILIRDPNLTQITSRARAYSLTIDGVTGVRRLEITHNMAQRRLDWIVDLETTGGPTGPFPLTT